MHLISIDSTKWIHMCNQHQIKSEYISIWEHFPWVMTQSLFAIPTPKLSTLFLLSRWISFALLYIASFTQHYVCIRWLWPFILLQISMVQSSLLLYFRLYCKLSIVLFMDILCVWLFYVSYKLDYFDSSACLLVYVCMCIYMHIDTHIIYLYIT